MIDYEKLGAFYLGRRFDPAVGAPIDEPVLYDSRDLVTHGVILGMTGSGKTGLGVSLLEEAAIDGVPAIVIDPKGDLGNLALTFPGLAPSDFRPWIDEGEATRTGLTVDALAAQTAEKWRKGLADWGQEPARIQRFRDAVELALYTPGSRAGAPISVLRSFAAPDPKLLEDTDGLADRVQAAVSGLLALAGIEADPIRSREHILLSNLLHAAWVRSADLDLGQLIQQIQSPPFEKIGVMGLDAFFPAKERFELALALNKLLASPGFAAWMEGEPLDVARLLYTETGKPRLAILSIAHLSDAERMFFVTLLLNEVVSWMRAQSGTSSLRAILYMDEVFGYFPPTASPPCKPAMLTLLKQARAFGLGVVLATQNPVDLDYKGLANAGTWWIGRLQTERDKARVLEGLEGASSSQGKTLDRASAERTLAGLPSRVFLMNNVHDDAPTLFQTRWALSYLRGPLTRAQVQTLSKTGRRVDALGAPRPSAAPTADAVRTQGVGAPAPGSAATPGAASRTPPVAPPEVPVVYMQAEQAGTPLQPALLATARAGYALAKANVAESRDLLLLAPLLQRGTGPSLPVSVWETSTPISSDRLRLSNSIPDAATFAELPADATKPKSYAAWSKALVDYIVTTHPLRLWRQLELKQISRPGESEGEFRARLSQFARERRDAELDKIRKRHGTGIARLTERIRLAEARVAREQADLKQQQMQTAISVGSTILGALLGGRRATGSRAATSLRSASRVGRAKSDVDSAVDNVDDLRAQLTELEAVLQADLSAVQSSADATALQLEELVVRAKKVDVQVAQIALAWVPAPMLGPRG